MSHESVGGGSDKLAAKGVVEGWLSRVGCLRVMGGGGGGVTRAIAVT